MSAPPGEPAVSRLAQRRIAFAMLLGCVVCLGMGQTITFAILPPIGRELGLSERQVGGIFSVSALMFVLMSPLWGRLSDAWGRKPVILIGMAGYIVSTTAFTGVIAWGLAGGTGMVLIYALMVATRSIYGAIGPGVRVASQAWIADRTSLADRTVAIAGMSAAFGLGNVLGPGLGSAFSVFGLLAPLWAIVVLVTLMTLATALLLPEKSAPGSSSTTPRLPLRDRRVRPFLLFGIATSFAVATPMQASAFYFIDVLGLETDVAAQFVGVGLSGAAMAALFSQLVLVQRFRLPPWFMMSAGAALIAAAQLAMAVSQTFAPMVFALMLNGLGAGMALPGFHAGASLAVTASEQGAVAGITGAMGALGFSIVPAVNFTLYRYGPELPFLFDAVLMSAMLALAVSNPTLRNSGRGLTGNAPIDEHGDGIGGG